MILNAHSTFSLRHGTIPVERLAKLAAMQGHEAIALTDINGSAGIIDFTKACRDAGVRPLSGMEFTEDGVLRYTAIAANKAGFKEINDLCTHRNVHGGKLPARPEFENCFVIFPKDRAPSKPKEHEYIGIRSSEINRARMERTELSKKYVALPNISFEKPNDFATHQKLRAVDNNLLLSQLAPHQAAPYDSFFRSRREIEQLYDALPNTLENARSIIRQCTFEYDLDSPKNKRTYTATLKDDRAFLEMLAFEGLLVRYGKHNKEAMDRVYKELEIIEKLGFASYFLIGWDTIHFTKSAGISHVGRGSGANSIIAYCLGITDVCPIELGLYFERFLNPNRNSPPDLDIDFSHKDRDRVIAYILKRYGAEHTALLGSMSTFSTDRSIIREIGKVHGLPKSDIDRLIAYPESKLNDNDICREVLAEYASIVNFPNAYSIHAGGILITEEPITTYTALNLLPKGFPSTQIDMYQAEDAKIHKLDILSQRGLGHIHEAVELVAENRGKQVDVYAFDEFKKDPAIKERLRSANTIGCFYIESPAMRQLLTKLRCNDYLTLVAASSIIRPGVSSSGMMQEYIRRFHNPTDFEYLHPIMREQLAETFGVMVYQEDVLKVGHYFGGLDLADADVLRRMMSGKSDRHRKQLAEIERKFFGHCEAVGHDPEISREVWRQIASFAGYSFSKAHSASYAVESYQSLFLKTYYPVEFMAAVINNEGGFYSRRVYVNEARRAGATIHLPCVNKSKERVALYGNDLYLGFSHLSGMEHKVTEAILAERTTSGEFADLEDFVRRVPITIEQLIILIRINAFRFTGKKKQKLLWEAHLLLNSRQANEAELFAIPTKKYELPELATSSVEDAYDEIELLGFPVSCSYFELLRTKKRGDCTASDMPQHLGKQVRMLGTYATHKAIRTKHGDPMAFGTFLDERGEFFDTVNFPKCFEQFPFTGVGVYLILGKVTEEFAFPSITVEKMQRLPMVADPRG